MVAKVVWVLISLFYFHVLVGGLGIVLLECVIICILGTAFLIHATSSSGNILSVMAKLLKRSVKCELNRLICHHQDCRRDAIN